MQKKKVCTVVQYQDDSIKLCHSQVYILGAINTQINE